MITIYSIATDQDGGVHVTHYAPKFIRQMVEGVLTEKGLKPAYLESASDAELEGLLSPNDMEDIKATLFGFVKDKIERDSGRVLSSPREINPDTLPDRYFRGAFKMDENGAVGLDMDKAREIHMSRIRRARDRRLGELDKRMYGDEYEAERRKLRDVPQTFDLSVAQTPEELKTLWPIDLPV